MTAKTKTRTNKSNGPGLKPPFSRLIQGPKGPCSLRVVATRRCKNKGNGKSVPQRLKPLARLNTFDTAEAVSLSKAGKAKARQEKQKQGRKSKSGSSFARIPTHRKSAMNGAPGESVPQRLKPLVFVNLYGTAEAVSLSRA
jgi:hypothetical protein